MSFKPGDVVQLKSGGPLMTVESARPDERGVPHVNTVWFSGTEPKNGYYADAALKLYEPPAGFAAPMRDPLAEA